MRTIEEIRQDYIEHGICADYLSMWESGISRRAIFEIGCTIQGLGFLAQGLTEGWGLTVEEICHMFRHYINGRYVTSVHRKTGDYDSVIWFNFDGKAEIKTTCAGMFRCHAEIDIHPWNVCYIFLDSSSTLEINCPNSARVIVENYGGKVSGTGRIQINDRIAV